ncbi:MAG: anti-sigma factor [Saprospiraceae bacterium]|nr:anti-sigma factor [Saprospiraceae bacterium]
MYTIKSNQAFQLWSLKDGVDPMPLNVFADKNTIIPVDFIDQTATYAITIEPKGGSKSPSLDKLIGTMGVI